MIGESAGLSGMLRVLMFSTERCLEGKWMSLIAPSFLGVETSVPRSPHLPKSTRPELAVSVYDFTVTDLHASSVVRCI
jgi:hypothetical protein